MTAMDGRNVQPNSSQDAQHLPPTGTPRPLEQPYISPSGTQLGRRLLLQDDSSPCGMQPSPRTAAPSYMPPQPSRPLRLLDLSVDVELGGKLSRGDSAYTSPSGAGKEILYASLA